jgi:DNA phosphorothioation-associated putative methyltransferase
MLKLHSSTMTPRSTLRRRSYDTGTEADAEVVDRTASIDQGAPPGKRVGGALYLHKDALGKSGPEAEKIRAAERAVTDCEWNVAKIEKSSVSLLLYEPFEEPFPALLFSTKVDLASGTSASTDYRGRKNPPILHRKELLLPHDDPRLPAFRALTAAAEEHGLFRDSNRIGTRTAWQSRIDAAGLQLRNGKLLRKNEDAVEVVRHKTAIVRRDLSQPMQLLMRFGVVAGERSLFDYGCGQGEDVEALSSQGFDAFGWDPHHAPRGRRAAADVVNLGFVLNVIEDPRERVETLKAAWGFARRALCVAVMVHGKVSTAGHKPFRDGFLTSRGTFQKYFEQQELRDMVAAATGETPLALASGIVAVFRDKDLEQEVLLRRRSGRFEAGSLPRPLSRERVVAPRPGARERIAPALEILHGAALALGRMPESEEIPVAALAGLAAARVSWSRALDLLRADLAGDEGYGRSAEARKQDLLVHLALTQVPGSPRYKTLPKSIQSDIRAFFGNHSAALAEGRRLLFAAGDRAALRTDAEAAVSEGLGGLRNETWFRFRACALPRLPSRLRVMVGCAEVLQGGVEAADFVDVDLSGPRVTMVTCDDIEQQVPFIVERVTVDLGRLKVRADRREPGSFPIYFKSRFLPRGDDLHEAQTEFEAALSATGLFPDRDAEPPWESVCHALKSALAKG